MSEVTCVHNQLGGRLFALASVHTSNSADSASWWMPNRATPPAAWLRGAMLAVIAVTLFTCTHAHVALVSLATITRPDNHVSCYTCKSGQGRCLRSLREHCGRDRCASRPAPTAQHNLRNQAVAEWEHDSSRRSPRLYRSDTVRSVAVDCLATARQRISDAS